MRLSCVFVFLAACGGGGGEGLEVQESSCQPDRFHYVHDLSLGDGVTGGEGDLSSNGVAFVNAGLQDAQGNPQPGSLQIFGSSGSGTSMIVTIEFQDLLARGGTVDARGRVELADQGIVAGNCEADGFSGRLSDFGDGWRFTLVELHASPYCSGVAFSGSFAGCTRSSN